MRGARVLVAYATLFGNTRRMAESVAEGARSVPGANVARVAAVLAAAGGPRLQADGVAASPRESLSQIAGMMANTDAPASGIPQLTK